jgi:hypothetical protein
VIKGCLKPNQVARFWFIFPNGFGSSVLEIVDYYEIACIDDGSGESEDLVSLIDVTLK